MKISLKGQNNGGFTQLELLVSAAIIAMMATLFITNYRVAERQYKLNSAVDQFASNIRLAQSYALGAKKVGSNVPLGGWGIYLGGSTREYIVFADVDPNSVGAFKSGADIVVASSTLPTGVEFKSSVGVPVFMVKDMAGNNQPSEEVSMLFLPPEPKVTINATTSGSGVIGSLATISLYDKLSGQTKSVALNLFGLVDILQ